jgi:hypothetical protein
MRRSSFRHLVLVCSLLAAGSVAHLASGADAKVEGEVRKLQGDAMDVDFLSLDLANAKKKLTEALKKCGEDKCGKKLVAGLHRDLGVVLVNNKDAKGGQSEFEAALEADESVVISKDYLDNPDVKKAWDAAKKAATAAPSPTSTKTGTAPTTTSKPPENNEGSITIKTAIAEAGYKLPIVIDIEEDADKIKLSYKTAAMDKYKTVEAKKAGKKYLVEIGCEDTQFPGEIKYYVRAYDDQGNEVDHHGTPKKPQLIKLVDKLPEGEEGATYADGKEPEKCTDKADCQPGFPCASKDKKHQGDGCDNDDECDSGLACVPNDNGTKWCYEAGEGSPKKAPSKAKRLWIGGDFQADILFLGAQDDICKANTWACVSDGRDVGLAPTTKYTDNIDTVSPGGSGRTSGGPALGTKRVFLSFDYFITQNISLGLRLGRAFGGNDANTVSFFPWHIEARAQYFFGKDPLATTGLKPYLMVGGGAAEFDAPVPEIKVLPMNQSSNVGGNYNPGDCNDGVLTDTTTDPANPVYCRRTGVKGYRLAGQGYAAVGGGVWFLVTPNVAINANLKLLFPLPTFSLGIAPELGIKVGL